MTSQVSGANLHATDQSRDQTATFFTHEYRQRFTQGFTQSNLTMSNVSINSLANLYILIIIMHEILPFSILLHRPNLRES